MDATTAERLRVMQYAAAQAYTASAEKAATRTAWDLYYASNDAADAARAKLEKADAALERARLAVDKAWAAVNAAQAASSTAYKIAAAYQAAENESPARAALDAANAVIMAATGTSDPYDARQALTQIVKAAEAEAMARAMDATADEQSAQ